MFWFVCVSSVLLTPCFIHLEADVKKKVCNKVSFCCYAGTIIHRHRIPKPPPDDDKFYTVEDFNVGIELNLYSKVFRIVDCDDFTLNFLRKLGVKVGAPERIPEDPFFTNRKAVSCYTCLRGFCLIYFFLYILNHKQILVVCYL